MHQQHPPAPSRTATLRRTVTVATLAIAVLAATLLVRGCMKAWDDLECGMYPGIDRCQPALVAEIDVTIGDYVVTDQTYFDGYLPITITATGKKQRFGKVWIAATVHGKTITDGVEFRASPGEAGSYRAFDPPPSLLGEITREELRNATFTVNDIDVWS